MKYKFISIEGNIGAGKTSLATKISQDFNSDLILESFAENPFLPSFYKEPEKYAFSLELFFMAERYSQLKSKSNQNLFLKSTVSDYFFMKSKLFAKNNLNNVLNNSIYNNLEIDLLSIDIEGSEFLALKEFDFNKYNPKVIVVEYLDLSLPALEIKNLNINSAINSDIYKLIVSKNYTFVNMLHSDLVFVNNKFRD